MYFSFCVTVSVLILQIPICEKLASFFWSRLTFVREPTVYLFALIARGDFCQCLHWPQRSLYRRFQMMEMFQSLQTARLAPHIVSSPSQQNCVTSAEQNFQSCAKTLVQKSSALPVQGFPPLHTDILTVQGSSRRIHP